MNFEKEKLLQLIQPVFDLYQEEIIPATEKQIIDFKSFAISQSVPEKTIDELIEFYKTTNGIPCLDSISIHEINDVVLFEFWDDKELWIGQRDMDMIRWKDDKYHLGDASDLNYGDEYISERLIGILEIGMKDWYPEDEDN